MKFGMVGAGRMGGAMTQRLLRAGHEAVVFDQSPEAVAAAVEAGATGALSLEGLVENLSAPRSVWVMVPAGEVTGSVISSLSGMMSSGDTLIDGGNSNYKDTQARAAKAAEAGVDLLDSGTSGGVLGLENGYCLTIGGSRGAYERNLPIFEALAPGLGRGQAWVGPSGSGHFVKMVHNGIEYGLMQAYAEGFELLSAKEEFGLDLGLIAENWRSGSVIRSWLLDLCASALSDDGELSSLSGYVEDSGGGRWTVDASVELGVPAPAITAALQARFRSRQENPLSGRILSALRNQFGGHSVRLADGSGKGP